MFEVRPFCHTPSELLTTFKIYTGKIPLGNIEPGDFRQLVANEVIRPDKDDTPYMADAIGVSLDEISQAKTDSNPRYHHSILCIPLIQRYQYSQLQQHLWCYSSPIFRIRFRRNMYSRQPQLQAILMLKLSPISYSMAGLERVNLKVREQMRDF